MVWRVLLWIKLTRLNQEYARFNKAISFKSRAEQLEVVGWDRRQVGKANSAYHKELEKHSRIHYNKSGTVQIDRTIYDENGMMSVQIHSGPHNRPDKHPHGVRGEHVHRYVWGDDGKLIQRISEDLSDLERVQHQDILGGEEADS